MRTLGLIGGMSWHSTVEYYQWINEYVARERGGHASARIALQSLDFEEIRHCQESGDWDAAGQILADAARGCVAGGATVVAICTNLMHKVAPQVEAAIDVPLLHIADAVADVARRDGHTTVGLLGTRWTMQETFYADRLGTHGIGVVIPDEADRLLVDRIIWDELTRGATSAASRAAYVRIIDDLARRGAESVVLGCTEISLLVRPDDVGVPLIDSARAHADALARVALS